MLVLTAATVAFGSIAVVAPTTLSIAADTSGAGTAITPSDAATADTVAAASVTPASSARPRRPTTTVANVSTLASPRSTTTTRAVQRAAVIAPYAFGTKAYNKWWARQIMAKKFGWTSTAQYSCLVNLWHRESHWNHKAHNRYSGAHGIPQALPGSKMASAGADWRTNPRTQITWGLGYIKARYGTPCGAWNSFQRKGWY